MLNDQRIVIAICRHRHVWGVWAAGDYDGNHNLLQADVVQVFDLDMLCGVVVLAPRK